jgi:hypothetical protein
MSEITKYPFAEELAPYREYRPLQVVTALMTSLAVWMSGSGTDVISPFIESGSTPTTAEAPHSKSITDIIAVYNQH